jgi:hypothetical protein
MEMKPISNKDFIAQKLGYKDYADYVKKNTTFIPNKKLGKK